MDENVLDLSAQFIETLGLEEQPMGIFFTDSKPAEGFSPKPMDLPTREREVKNEIDWQSVFTNFSCAIGKIWLARKKQTAAYFTAKQFGCAGAAYWMGFLNPQTDTIINYVSSGVPNRMKGELYCDSPENLKNIFEKINPEPAAHKYCVFKPLNTFTADENPKLVTFFARPEVLSGLHQLAMFVTNDPEVVVSPWSSACGSLVVWPLHYLAKNQHKAVLGGWDPSARKFFKTDELSFTVPFAMFLEMVNRYQKSFLNTSTWGNVTKKINRSKKAWGER